MISVFTPTVARLISAIVFCAAVEVVAQQTTPQLPSAPLQYGAFTMQFASDGVFTILGKEWPPLKGAWTVERDEVTLTTRESPECTQPGRYRFRVENLR